MSLPNIPNVVSTEELIETAEAIIDWQLPNGMIPWFPGGHSDPWNHVEAAMALAVTGHLDAAEQAYIWLKDNQLPLRADSTRLELCLLGSSSLLEV